MARIGYASRGIIYLTIGILALLQSIGSGGNSTNSKGAVKALFEAPFGAAIIWTLGAGLLAYSAWRMIQAIFNADHHDKDTKGYSIRFGLLCSSLSHAALAVYTFTLATQLSSGSGGLSSTEGVIAFLLKLPFGPLIVILIALAVGAVGIAHFAKAYKASYQKRFDISQKWMDRINPICRYGLYSRGLLFLIISGMITTAAITQDADEAGGMKEVLKALQQQAYGSYLLFAMSIGLLLFASYCFIESAARKIKQNPHKQT